MKRFTIKARGSLLGILYTKGRVFVATEDGERFSLLEFDRAAPDAPLSTEPHPSKRAVLDAMKDRFDARTKEER
jgi:hypothetical protein